MSIARVVQQRRPELAKQAWKFAEKKDMTEALEKLEPTALRTLLGVAINASCLKEIQIMLRYQQGRDREKWPESLASGISAELEAAVAAAGPTLQDLAAEERDRAETRIATTWLGFVVRLHRYHSERAKLSRGPRR